MKNEVTATFFLSLASLLRSSWAFIIIVIYLLGLICKAWARSVRYMNFNLVEWWHQNDFQSNWLSGHCI